MNLIYPSYYKDFKCIAGACPDSCCHEWDVQVDEEAAARYRAMEGALGDDLRKYLYDEEGATYLRNEGGRCPMWRSDGLCRIQAELGEEALCKTCREFPRLIHDYGDFIEYGLELSCPEAARIILSVPARMLTEEVSGGEAPEYDEEAMETLLRTRETARELLGDCDRSVAQSLALLLMYGYQAQGELDGEAPGPFDPEISLMEARNFARPGDPAQMAAFFRELEILTPEWAARLENPDPGAWEPRHLLLARYFVDRYWLQAVSDYDLVSRVKLAVISCLMIRELGGDPVPTAQLYSKEIENDIDNVEAILDAAYAQPAFTDDRLLGMILG